MGVTHRHRDDAYFSRDSKAKATLTITPTSVSSGTNNEGLVLIHGYW